MPRRVEEDHKDFHDVYAGRKRKELKKYIKNGNIFRSRGKNGKIVLTIPKIDIPHIVYGDSGNGGIGRGEGESGKLIGKEKDQGEGKGNKAGQDEGEGIDIAVDLDPLNIVAINNKGGCLYLLGRQREAISCFSKAFEVNSSLARPKSQPVNSNTNNKKRF